VSALLVWYQRRRHRGTVVMTIMMVGWAMFGLSSLYFFFNPGLGYLSQDYYLSLCGVWIALLPFMISPQLAPRDYIN
jgi:hypothetical protein